MNADVIETMAAAMFAAVMAANGESIRPGVLMPHYRVLTENALAGPTATGHEAVKLPEPDSRHKHPRAADDAPHCTAVWNLDTDSEVALCPAALGRACSRQRMPWFPGLASACKRRADA